MPAINPARLAEEVKEIQGLIGNPQRLRSRLMDMLEFYADRTRRTQSTLRRGHADKKYGVPLPVLHALERGLKEAVFEAPEHAATILEELWRIDVRETRYLAIALLENRPLEVILRHAETWSLEIKDPELQRKLSQLLARSWKKADFQDFSTTSTDWLKGKQVPLKWLAILTFRYVAEDPEFADLPLIFHLLRVHDVAVVPELRRDFHDLLRALIRRSEAESVRFLLDILDRDISTGRKLIRGTLDCFSPDQQRRLKFALST